MAIGTPDRRWYCAGNCAHSRGRGRRPWPSPAPPARRPAPLRSPRRGAVAIGPSGMERAPHKDLYHFVLALRLAGVLRVGGATFLAPTCVRLRSTWSQPGSIANARPGSFEDAFYFSVQTIATIGYGGMYPAHPLRAHRGRDRGDDRNARHRRHHRADLHPVLASVRARAVLRQDHHHPARRRSAPDVPDGQLAPQPHRRGAASRRPTGRPSGRAKARCCAGRSTCRWCATETAMFFLTWTAMHRIDETARSTARGPWSGCATGGPSCSSA